MSISYTFLLIQTQCPSTTDQPTTEPPTDPPIVSHCPSEELLNPCACFEDAFEDGALLLNCDWQDIEDEAMSNILNAFLTGDENINPLRTLRLEHNKLTKIPDQIKLLSAVEEVYLWDNLIETITSGSLTFTATEKIIGLGDKIQTIESGAFVGMYKNLKIQLL